jgi:hypothetical protein
MTPTLAAQPAYCRRRFRTKCFSIEETATILDVSTDKVLELHTQGELIGHRPGWRDAGVSIPLRFTAYSIDCFMRRRRW